MQYIDIHTHINLVAFKDDYDEVVRKTLDEDVWMINVGTQHDTSVFALELAKKYEKGVYATVGLHPIHTSASFYDKDEFDEAKKAFIEHGEKFNAQAYEQVARDEKVVAIGECGLDYFRDISDGDWKKQIEAFEAQIALANEIHKPLMLHVRNGSRGNAYKDVFEIIKKQAKVIGNVHFFAGTFDDATLFWNIGFSTSFTGVITFTHQYDDVVRHAPCDLLHAETDAPYVTPVPYRGKRNEPFHVREVVKKMAEIRGVHQEILQDMLIKNAHAFFGVPM